MQIESRHWLDTSVGSSAAIVGRRGSGVSEQEGRASRPLLSHPRLRQRSRRAAAVVEGGAPQAVHGSCRWPSWLHAPRPSCGAPRTAFKRCAGLRGARRPAGRAPSSPAVFH